MITTSIIFYPNLLTYINDLPQYNLTVFILLTKNKLMGGIIENIIVSYFQIINITKVLHIYNK